jgi:hypothetical protein
MIENKDFENNYLVNGISLPFKSRTTLSNKLRERGAVIEAEVKEILLSDQVVSIHLQTDLWQSPSKKHFISLIGTFVDKSFAYREVLLSFCEFGSQHTGQNIARAIFAILEEYKITSKLTGITTDGASNNINMMAELDNLYRNYRTEKGEDAMQELSVLFDADTWFHCLSHILHLLSTTLLNEYVDFNDILSKVRKVASIIRLSDYYRCKFKEFCQRCKIAFTMPPGEVVTRWNSTFELLVWFLRFRQPLSDYLKSVYSDASERIKNQLRELGSSAPFGETVRQGVDLAFSNKEWQEITLMRHILEPFYNFMCIFNKSQSFCSDALNAFFYIEEFLKDITEATTPTKVNNLFKLHAIPCNYSVISPSLRSAARMACAKLAKYFERADLMDMVYLSNAMDPRYKGEVIEKNVPEYATPRVCY